MHLKALNQLVALVLGLGLLASLATGCVSVPTPGVYKLDIQQGNVVTEDMLARLEPNMEKRKVRFLLGTPLVADTFNVDRWDYIYSFQEGGGKRSQKHIVLIFADDRLLRVEGDADNSAIEAEPAPKLETVVSVPDQEPEGIFGGIGSWFGTDETRVPRQKPPPGDDDSDQDDGFFATIFDGDSQSDSIEIPAPEVPVTTDDVESSGAEQATVFEQPVESAEEYDQNITTGDTTTDIQEDGDDGFFARLKKKFSGGDDIVEASDGDPEATEASDSTVEEDDEPGFFERLSGQFGLDAPAESRQEKD